VGQKTINPGKKQKNRKNIEEKIMKKLVLKLVFLSIMAASGMVVSAQSRISFARGRTSATVSGKINGQMDRSYVLTARYGQVLSANISSSNGCVQFTNGATSITYITESGNNFLYIINRCRNTTSFTITVSINYGSD
jgi:hypothetical protein